MDYAGLGQQPGCPQVGASHQVPCVSKPKQSHCRRGDRGTGADHRAAVHRQAHSSSWYNTTVKANSIFLG